MSYVKFRNMAKKMNRGGERPRPTVSEGRIACLSVALAFDCQPTISAEIQSQPGQPFRLAFLSSAGDVSGSPPSIS